MGANSEDIEIEDECGNFFEQIEDIIQFPPEDSGDSVIMSCNDGKDVLSLWDNVLPECHPLFPDETAGLGFPDDQLSFPYEDDIAHLEWLSAFVEDSFSGGGSTLGNGHFCSNKDVQISSPVSVLESSTSSSCCSGEKIETTLRPSAHPGPQRARSKRPRPASFNPRPEIHLIPESFAGSEWKIPKPVKVESKKKMKMKAPSASDQEVDDQNPPVRKCLHCEITKTPQWRAGPMGPKTLCNACGVRYKSGRLFPEYRPAASPTFVPSVHSNSHKKVVEMRTNVNARATGTSELSEIVSNS